MSLDNLGILPITNKLLRYGMKTYGQKAIESKRGGMDEAGGDAYHDEQFADAENNFYLNEIRKKDASILLGNGEIMSIPDQNHTAMPGHMIIIKIKNDPYIPKGTKTVVHLVSDADKQALDQYCVVNSDFRNRFNNEETSMIMSISSPL